TTSNIGSLANWVGAVRSALSMVSWTSAWLREGRAPEPEKITSSMPPARMALAELAPITQRRASSRFDLPQPFGPTTPVSPGSIRNSIGSMKDLKPERRRRWNCTGSAWMSLFAGLGGGDGGVQLWQRVVAGLERLAVDDEGRRAADMVV